MRERLGLEEAALARSQRALYALAGRDLDVQLIVGQFQLVRPDGHTPFQLLVQTLTLGHERRHGSCR